MFIIICGCDVLKCKAHLNPPANYRMFGGGVSAAEVGLGLSRGLKHRKLASIKWKIRDHWERGEGGGRVYSAMYQISCINHRLENPARAKA